MAYFVSGGHYEKGLLTMNEAMWCKTHQDGVWMYGDSENSDFTVMIMAGIHPEEEAGVLCLERLLQDSEWLFDYRNICVIAVPCRNTFGFHIKQCFANSGILDGELFFENSYCKIFKYKEEYLVVLKPPMVAKTERKDFWKALQISLKEAKVKGFVHLLSFRRSIDLRANTYYFSGEDLVDMNDIGRYPTVSYICAVENVARTHHPNLVIDLHEGKGKESYVYVDEKNASAIANGKDIISCFRKMGIPVRKCAEDRRKIADGVYSLQQLHSGEKWIKLVDNGKIVVLEAGIENDIEKRIEGLQTGVMRCIAFEWEQNKRTRNDI